MTTTLYLTRNGLLEPLGQSQVLPYLRGLSRDYRIILITREKAEDWADERAVEEARAECAALGIDWRPKPFRPHPRYIGPARDILTMLRDVRRAVREEKVRLVHARAYIPAAVAWAVGRLTGTPFIFDMRALWPEELITAGRLRRGSPWHKAISWMERTCLRDAAAVVSLTQAAADHLREREAGALAHQKIAVIPTCADLERFTPRSGPKLGPVVHGCIGTVLSGWFRAEWLATWWETIATNDPNARFDIATRDNPKRVRILIDPQGKLGDRLTIAPRSPKEMPEAISKHDISAMFFTGGLSKLGSAPTRMAEILGSGLPVVANPGVGDVERTITRNRVGILLKGTTTQDVQDALGELNVLLADPDLTARCRHTAEEYFSVEAGTGQYRSLYAEILGQNYR